MNRTKQSAAAPSDDLQFLAFVAFLGLIVGLLAACGALA
jgi:hypothetical protein